MCDTLYKKTADGFLFGKNSDRSPNEPNLVLFHSAGIESDPVRRCTYIGIDSVAARHGVAIVRPSWMWGAEMGVNDAGVVIGNEAVFTRSKGKKTERLTGMDLLRLALERAASAADAVRIVTALLDRYGQGGNCGFDKPFYYDNSFLIAGSDGAFILETCGSGWIVKDVSDAGNISNMLSQDGPYLMTSGPGLECFARKNREPVFTFFAKAKGRSCQAADALGKPGFGVLEMMAALRSHVPSDTSILFEKGSVGSLCMHKSALGDHTTGSMIHVARKTASTTWITGSSTPCLSLYKPTYFGNAIPPVFLAADESLTYWLDREYLVRAIYAGFVDPAGYRHELAEIQNSFVDGDERLIARKATAAELKAFQKACSDREQAFVESRREAIDKIAENPLVLPDLPPLWRRKTAVLGDNVFAHSLSARIQGK